MPDSYITDEMRAAVGRRYGRTVSFPVDSSDIRKWAIAVYYPELPPAHYIDEAASTDLFGGVGLVAPEDFNPFAWVTAEPGLSPRGTELDLNFYENALGIPSPGLAVNLNSGLTVEYGARIRTGDVITKESWVDEYTEKTGRMGLMLFTYMVTEMTNQHGEVVRRTRQLGIRY